MKANHLLCVFCNKNQNEVRKLIAHTPVRRPDLPKFVAICDECLDLCNEIMRFERGRQMLAEDIGA